MRCLHLGISLGSTKAILCAYQWAGCKALDELLNKFDQVFVYTHACPVYVPDLIALCEEKLGNYVQATETYSSIEEYVNSVQEAREGMVENKYLNFVFGMAKWRREQLEDTRAIRQAVNRYGIYSVPNNSDPELSAN